VVLNGWVVDVYCHCSLVLSVRHFKCYWFSQVERVIYLYITSIVFLFMCSVSQECYFKWSLASSHIQTYRCQRLDRNFQPCKSQVSLVSIRYGAFVLGHCITIALPLCWFVRWHRKKKNEPMNSVSFILLWVLNRLGGATASVLCSDCATQCV
jgi:ABC-type spermidine/putrescine transport system permease subunit I